MFLEPERFPFTGVLRSHAAVIRAELESLQEADFVPWQERGLYTNEGWKVFPLLTAPPYTEGPYAHLVATCAANAKRCPRTVGLLRSLPGCAIATFSWMAPGTQVLPHCGEDRGIVRCHLCLVESDDCALAFGSDARAWRAGECLVFDDTRMHEAWNRGRTPRIVLLADFVHAQCEPASGERAAAGRDAR